MGNAINIPRYVSPKQAIRSALGNLGKGNLMQTMEPDLIRWSIEAQDLISPINVLQKKSEIFKVSDNRVTLCEDFKMVECVKINGVPLRYLGGRNCQYITKGCYDSCNTIGSGLGFSVDSCYVHFSPAIQDGTEVEVTWLQRPVGDDGIPLVVEQCLIAVQDYISWMICLRTMDNRAGIHEKNWYYRCRTARAEMNRFAESQRQQLGVQYLSVYNNPFYDWDAYMGACGGGSGAGSGSGSGVPGPQGPQGPAGPQGPQGPAGSAAMALQQYATQGDFPATGDVNTLYLDQSTDSLYYWDEATVSYVATAGGSGGVWGTIVGVLSNQTDLQNALNAKQNVSNLSINVVADQTSNTKYPSVKAVYDWVLSLGYITASALTGYATQAWVNAQGYITNVITALGYTPVPETRTISTTTPLAGGGDLSANRTLSIADAVADGSTKGAAAFNANDFDSAAGVISIDYTNGQKASALQPGFLAAADFSTFNGKQNALNGTGFVLMNGTVVSYDILSISRVFYQTCVEQSVTGVTTEQIVDTVLLPNTLAANDILDLYARFLKTTTANATIRVYTNTVANLTGTPVQLAIYVMAAATRLVGFKRSIVCKASGLIEVASSTTNTISSDLAVLTSAESTTTITYSGTNYLIITLQLVNAADVMRRSFLQIQHQRQA